MKKKSILIIAGLIILLGGFLVKWRGGGKTEVAPSPTTSIALSEVSEDVEVNLTSRYDKKAVILTISQIAPETTSIDYELSYETAKGLPRGVLGTLHLKGGEEKAEREILLGTCSRNVCVYDEGVKKVNLVLKFNSSSGSSQFQKEYEL